MYQIWLSLAIIVVFTLVGVVCAAILHDCSGYVELASTVRRALGDVDLLRKLNHPEDRTACIEAVTPSNRVRDLIAQAEDDWFLAVEDALARNRSTSPGRRFESRVMPGT